MCRLCAGHGAAALRDTDRHSPPVGLPVRSGLGQGLLAPQLKKIVKLLSHQHPQAQADPRPTLSSRLPSFLKVEAWKTHVWQDEKRRPQRRVIRFQVLAK